MIVGEHTRRWLLHRYGVEALDHSWPRFQTRALELNKRGPDFAATFGKRTVIALTGFLDLIGFSDRVKGSSPAAVAAYVVPFLDRITKTVVESEGLVDKTIGDEVMFVLPDFESEGEVSLIQAAQGLIRRLWILRHELAAPYPFRLGLSVGMVYVGRVEGEGYAEWTVFGEAVNLAKRIADVPRENELAARCAGGTLGVLVHEEPSQEYFDVLLKYFRLKGSSPTAELLVPPPPLKGISPYRCALLV